MFRFYPQRYARLLGLCLLCSLLATPSHAAAHPAPPRLNPTTEVSVLQSVIRQLFCFNAPTVSQTGNTYRFDCMVAMGHSTAVSIKRYATPAEALAALTAIYAEPRDKMGCYVAAAWVYYGDPANQTFRHRNHVWAADKWLMEVYSFDDTYYSIAYEPNEVSGYIMQAAQSQLFPACHQFYLPGMFHP